VVLLPGNVPSPPIGSSPDQRAGHWKAHRKAREGSSGRLSSSIPKGSPRGTEVLPAGTACGDDKGACNESVATIGGQQKNEKRERVPRQARENLVLSAKDKKISWQCLRLTGADAADAYSDASIHRAWKVRRKRKS
jgi:hypothetical protein